MSLGFTFRDRSARCPTFGAPLGHTPVILSSLEVSWRSLTRAGQWYVKKMVHDCADLRLPGAGPDVVVFHNRSCTVLAERTIADAISRFSTDQQRASRLRHRHTRECLPWPGGPFESSPFFYGRGSHRSYRKHFDFDAGSCFAGNSGTPVRRWDVHGG